MVMAASRLLLIAAGVCGTPCPSATAADAVVVAAVKARMSVGLIKSISGPMADPPDGPVESVCLAIAGADPPRRVIRQFRAPYEVIPMSECPYSGFDSYRRLQIDYIRWRNRREAEVGCSGLLPPHVTFLVRKARRGWTVVGAIGGIVG